jgi:hypothetical protein
LVDHLIAGGAVADDATEMHVAVANQ